MSCTRFAITVHLPNSLTELLRLSIRDELWRPIQACKNSLFVNGAAALMITRLRLTLQSLTSRNSTFEGEKVGSFCSFFNWSESRKRLMLLFPPLRCKKRREGCLSSLQKGNLQNRCHGAHIFSSLPFTYEEICQGRKVS